MTPEAQRIAIAEACGWKKSDLWAWDGQDCYEHAKHDPRTALQLPDYLNDLNAMHEAHETLTHDQHRIYRRHLQEIVYNQGHFDGNKHRSVSDAAAAQRAEAFLRTLNLWRDET